MMQEKNCGNNCLQTNVWLLEKYIQQHKNLQKLLISPIILSYWTEEMHVWLLRLRRAILHCFQKENKTLVFFLMRECLIHFPFLSKFLYAIVEWIFPLTFMSLKKL